MKQVRIFIVVIIAGIFLAGCMGMHHDTKPTSQRSADMVECQEKVRAASAGASAPSAPQDEVRLVNECMRKKGWK